MSQRVGRNEHAGEWPNRHPLWTYAVMFLALMSVAAVCIYPPMRCMGPLELPTSRYISVPTVSNEEWPLSDAPT